MRVAGIPLGVLKKKVYDTSKTVLLLNFNGVNGSGVFTDSSQYANTIYKEGTPTIQDNSGYFFDPNNAIYTTMPTLFDLSVYTGDFTVEAIINTNALGDYQGIIGTRWSSTESQWILYLDKDMSNKVVILCNFSDGSSTYIAHETIPTINTDIHIAVVRKNNVLKLYVNGVAASSTYDTTGKVLKSTFSSTVIHIGRLNYGFQTNSVNAYIRELRIRKEAVYIGNFTPPTSRLRFSQFSQYCFAQYPNHP